MPLARRALALLTAAASLTTLLSGALSIAAVTKNGSTRLAALRGPLVVALVFHVSAATVALVMQLPGILAYPDSGALKKMVEGKDWDDPQDISSREVARAHIEMLTQQEKSNRWRGYALAFATMLEVGGVIATAVVAWKATRG